MNTSRSQRWRDSRALWTDDETVIDPRAYSVDLIAHDVASIFISAHHYLPNYPAAQVAVGLFGPRGTLAGVAVFARPAVDAVITAHTGFTDPAKGTVLARLLLLDGVPQNGESFFVARAFDVLRRERPAVEAVVSYSDPQAGHIGRVYAALSGAHRGVTKPRIVLRLNGTTVSAARCRRSAPANPALPEESTSSSVSERPDRASKRRPLHGSPAFSANGCCSAIGRTGSTPIASS